MREPPAGQRISFACHQCRRGPELRCRTAIPSPDHPHFAESWLLVKRPWHRAGRPYHEAPLRSCKSTTPQPKSMRQHPPRDHRPTGKLWQAPRHRRRERGRRGLDPFSCCPAWRGLARQYHSHQFKVLAKMSPQQCHCKRQLVATPQVQVVMLLGDLRTLVLRHQRSHGSAGRASQALQTRLSVKASGTCWLRTTTSTRYHEAPRPGMSYR